MLQAFRDSYRDALARRGTVGMRFWLAVIGDEARSLGREYGAALREEGQRLRPSREDIASGTILLGSVVVYVVRCVI